MRVRGRAVAGELRVRLGAAALGDLGGFEHEQRPALAHDEAVALRVERSRGVLGIVVRARGERPDDVERPECERAQRHLDAAGERRVDGPVANRAQCLAERDRARRARVGGRQDRPADVEVDPDVGRRRAAEDRERERRRDGLDAAREVALVLLLGVGDAAERAAEVDADPLRLGGARPRQA